MAAASSVVFSKLVRVPSIGQGTGQHDAEVFHLSPCDQLSVTTATSRASFFKGVRVDEGALERCLEALLGDLPFLAGRVTPVQGLKLGSVHVALSNQGALLTVVHAPGVTLEELGPDSWVMKRIALSNPAVPFYLDRLDASRLLMGREPVLKVRLSCCADGDVLGITLCHAVTDGMRWPAFMAHFAARYRQAATGIQPAPESLLRPPSRAGLSSAGLAAALDLDAFKVKDLVIVHLPKAHIQELKAQAAASSAGSPAVTTGDVAQALAGMLVRAAAGSPLLPLAPKCQVVLVQLKGVHPHHFGNAVHLLPVKVPPGAGAAPEEDCAAVLAQLSGLIHAATAEFRACPAASVAAVAELERLVSTPVHRMLGWLAGHRLPNVDCTTNYIGALPADKELDFGFGAPPSAVRWLVTPLGSDMAVIRPAMPPYREGLFVHMTLTPQQAQRLRAHPLLGRLAPEARFVGAGEAAGAVAVQNPESKVESGGQVCNLVAAS